MGGLGWLGVVAGVVAVGLLVVWPLGWLVVEEWRDRTLARRAAREAQEWLRARRSERGRSPRSGQSRGPGLRYTAPDAGPGGDSCVDGEVMCRG